MRLDAWIESANKADCPFPLNNLPFGVARIGGGAPKCVTAIGDQIVDLAMLSELGVFETEARGNVFAADTLNAFMGLGPAAWRSVREKLQSVFAAAADDRDKFAPALSPLADGDMQMPIEVCEYTDFYSCRQHAFNVGTMFRGPKNSLPANWLHVPIGYNGRASSVVVSGTPIRRPLGQTRPPNAASPLFGPCRRLDFELEMGAVIGKPSEMGKPLSLAEASESIFGYVLLNDWSARDIQAWEAMPLGPFQSKVFATSISPWVVTGAALAPFEVAPQQREVELLAYLGDSAAKVYDIELSVELAPAGAMPTTISRTNASNLYYSAGQQLVHHAIGGCPMRTGDLLGSGTISGPEKNSFGSLLELSWGGKEPITLDGGATRSFLEDGDRVTLRGIAVGNGFSIGFGACTGEILPAPAFP